ncbi:hypothetical protein IEQ34_019333 [Dendrobium chrysotoxum]|uniref:Uncharacterized protein n=1 Tax=Dendrobium chrysotoxum TaxID=161865 RepID=A0AAV7G8B5_DENCH|nr:hypothetical protein IEQ34_019333 [Dendrobium chrysotoxum]
MLKARSPDDDGSDFFKKASLKLSLELPPVEAIKRHSMEKVDKITPSWDIGEPLHLFTSTKSSAEGPAALASASTGFRTTHKNLWPLISNPKAISFVCLKESVPPLPNAMNNTDRPGCWSSHCKQRLHSAWLLSDLLSQVSGPMEKTEGFPFPLSLRNLAGPPSMASKLLTMIPST